MTQMASRKRWYDRAFFFARLDGGTSEPPGSIKAFPLQNSQFKASGWNYVR